MAGRGMAEHDRVVSEYVDVWNEGDYEKLSDVVAESIALYDPGAPGGEFNGIPPTGNEIDLRGMDEILVADGKVQEHRVYYDLQELFEQLGLVDE